MDLSPEELMELERAELGDLKSFARAGMARDSASRLGKKLPGEEMPEDEMHAADGEVPGVELEDENGGEGMTEEVDPEILKQLLAALEAKGGV